jgi:ATP-dependent DNA helicase RecG
MINTAAELDDTIADLNRFRTDHQWVEAKRARGDIPNTLWQSLSAFANSETGGLVLLGVAEEKGQFAIVGVEDAARTLSKLQSFCGLADPPLRPFIATIHHPDGVVVAAHIAPVPPNRRPCHFPSKGSVHETSYVRVGDGDMPMTRGEVEALLSAVSGEDYSCRPAEKVTLNQGAVKAFISAVQPERDDKNTPDTVLRRWGVVTAEGSPTLAGALALGDAPHFSLPSARLACRRLPRATDPSGTRHVGTHVEGTIGENVEGALGWLSQALGAAQVVRQGAVYDEPDYPLEAFRELVANALVHRSLAPGQESVPGSIAVSDRVVVISNPGGLSPGVELRKLGLERASSPRNYTLVRLCERLRTPSGARIMESQSSGIAAADAACNRANVAPPLFTVTPTTFTAFALRGRLDLERTTIRHPQLANSSDDHVRLAAFMDLLAEAQVEDGAGLLRTIHTDLWLAARVVLKPIHQAATILKDLVALGAALERKRVDGTGIWAAADEDMPIADEEQGAGSGGYPKSRDNADNLPLIPGVSKRRQESMRALLRTLLDKELQHHQIHIGLKPRALHLLIGAAIDADLIEATTELVHDPTRAYRLTARGQSYAENLLHMMALNEDSLER